MMIFAFLALLSALAAVSYGAVAIEEVKAGDPLELTFSHKDNEPLIFHRTLDSDKDVVQYLFPCQCNNGTWTDGSKYYGEGATATFDGKMRIEKATLADAGAYGALNEEVRDGVARTVIFVKVTQEVRITRRP